jgi:hypothetical protein
MDNLKLKKLVNEIRFFNERVFEHRNWVFNNSFIEEWVFDPIQCGCQGPFRPLTICSLILKGNEVLNDGRRLSFFFKVEKFVRQWTENKGVQWNTGEIRDVMMEMVFALEEYLMT